jgi:hypothetical protein
MFNAAQIHILTDRKEMKNTEEKKRRMLKNPEQYVFNIAADLPILYLNSHFFSLRLLA